MVSDSLFLVSNRQQDSEFAVQSHSASAQVLQTEQMDKLFDDLAEILDLELEQYRELIRLLRTQREAFASNDIGSFETISKQQGTVVLRIKTLEEARKSIVLRLAEFLDVPPEGLTLGKLADLMDNQRSERCAEYQKEIFSIIKELESLKENNAYLMKQALHYVSGVLRIFASTHTTNFSYSKSGQSKPEAKKGKYLSGWG